MSKYNIAHTRNADYPECIRLFCGAQSHHSYLFLGYQPPFLANRSAQAYAILAQITDLMDAGGQLRYLSLQLRTKPSWIIALSGLLIVAAALGWLEMRPPKLDNRIYRIGFDNEPPQHFIGKDGKPTGLAIDLIGEAARRAGIRLQWQLEPESAEAALKSKGWTCGR